LRQFAIASRQLQGDPATDDNRQTLGRFDEYLPVVEFLLDHLETAVTGWIIDLSSETANQDFTQLNIFEGIVHSHFVGFFFYFLLGMDRKTRRILKVYLRLGWLKLHAYYEKLTSIAYAGAVVMNPFRKLPFLQQLWQQVPGPKAAGYLRDCKTRLGNSGNHVTKSEMAVAK
jgi:hypothetical protein